MYQGIWRPNNGTVEGLNPQTGQWETLYQTGPNIPQMNSAGNALVMSSPGQGWADSNGDWHQEGNAKAYNPGDPISGADWALQSQLPAMGIEGRYASPIAFSFPKMDTGDYIGQGILTAMLAGLGGVTAGAALGGGAVASSGAAADALAAEGGALSLPAASYGVGTGAAGAGGALGGAGLADALAGEQGALSLPASSYGVGTGGAASGAAGAASQFASDESPGAFAQGTAMPGSSTIGAAAAGTGLGGASSAAPSALSKLTGLDDATLKLIGQVAPGLLGAYGANQQSSALSDLAKQYLDIGAPSRGRFEASMTPGFDVNSIPGYTGALDSASQAVMSKLSTQGNPYGNPGALIEANKQIVNGTALPALQEYQRLNLAGGGQASLNAAVPGIQQQAIGSQGGVLSSLGSSIQNTLNPPSTLADLLKSLNTNQPSLA